MKYLTILLILFVTCSNVYARHSSNNFNQQQLLLQQNLLQQQIQILQQQLQQLQQENKQNPNEIATSFKIILPKPVIDDFEYLPTVQGYIFSYQLPDGSRRVENGFITGLRMDDISLSDSRTADFTAVGVGGRPKINLKNRKLAIGSLKSLAG